MMNWLKKLVGGAIVASAVAFGALYNAPTCYANPVEDALATLSERAETVNELGGIVMELGGQVVAANKMTDEYGVQFSKCGLAFGRARQLANEAAADLLIGDEDAATARVAKAVKFMDYAEKGLETLKAEFEKILKDVPAPNPAPAT